MIPITKSQKKILAIALAASLACILFAVFVYFPSKAAVRHIKKELADTQRVIQEIEAMVDEGVPLHIGIDFLQQKLRVLEETFISKEGDGFKVISGTARECDVEISSLRPQPKKAVLGADGTAVEIDGKAFQHVGVVLQARCLYADLAKFTERLESGIPILVSIEKVKITKRGADDPLLDVTIELNLYLLS